ncbi:hypothetical protein ALP75_201970 [Pseudomonas syringae pv. actinidiae]|nr:hypothetical protein ALP75_201970 [Pseudomonas syringae pv. actinidiae]
MRPQSLAVTSGQSPIATVPTSGMSGSGALTSSSKEYEPCNSDTCSATAPIDVLTAPADQSVSTQVTTRSILLSPASTSA